MNFRLLSLTLLLLLSACAITPKPREYGFNDKLNENTKKSIALYDEHIRLPNGMIYGDSVRYLNLRGETAQSLKAVMKELHCPLTEEVIREPVKNEPTLDKAGHTSPIWIWTCPDGGIVRAKPEGDPNSKFRPQPHASKALRYPVENSLAPVSFNDETAKIDNEGRILPKWPKDLNTTDPLDINAWADATHTDLKK